MESYIAAKDAVALDRERITELLRGLLDANKDIMGTYVAWEKNAVDGKDDLHAGAEHTFKNGQFAPYWSRSNNNLALRPLNLQFLEDGGAAQDSSSNFWYTCPLKQRRICLTEPYSWEAQGQTIVGTSITMPLMVNGTYYGMGGIDISLGYIQKIATDSAQKLYGGQGTVMVLSNTGLVAGHSGDRSLIGKQLPADELNLLRTQLQNGSDFITSHENNYVSLAAIRLPGVRETWGVVVEIPKSVVLSGVVQTEEVVLTTEELIERQRNRSKQGFD